LELKSGRVESTARSIGALSVLGFINGLVGLLYSVTIAYFFGTTRSVEIFFAASSLVGIIGGLTQSNFLAEVFLPVFLSLKQERGIDFAFRSFSVIVNWMILVFIPIALFLFAAGQTLIELIVPGFGAADHVLGGWFFRALIPVFLLNILQIFMMTLLNAERRFGRPESVMVTSAIFRLLLLIGLARLLGIWALIAGMVFYSIYSVVGMAILLWRIGYRHAFVLRIEGFSSGVVFRKVLATSVSEISLQFYQAVVYASLSFLPQGIFGAYKYTESLFFGIATVTITPNTKVFFTSVSSALAAKKKGIRKMLEKALGRNFGMVMLATIAAFVAARPLLRGLWQGATFHEEKIELASTLMKVFFLLLFALGVFHILRKTVIALGHAHALYYGVSVVYVLMALVAWLAIRNWGWWGLLLNLICFRVLEMLVPWAILMIRQRALAVIYPLSIVKPWLFAGGSGIAAGWLVKFLVREMMFHSTRLGSLGLGIGLTAFSVSIAIFVAWLLGVPEVRLIWTTILRRIHIPNRA
jgi:peptidoglycan biosynthesis protein MviN/MurJ (putative lipid II flippase)